MSQDREDANKVRWRRRARAVGAIFFVFSVFFLMLVGSKNPM